MRKNLIALLGFLSGVAVYYIKAPAPQQQETLIEEFHQQEFVSTRMSAPQDTNQNESATVIPVAEPPADISKEKFVDLEGLPRGMKFAPQVKAVSKEGYIPSMGPRLLEKNGFVFYRTEEAGETNVVYDKRLRTFHPLTATIKISGVSEEQRIEVTKNWDEYHYNKELGVQYVQSTHAELLDDFAEIKKNGFRASFEVIQAVYQTR